MSLLDTHVTPSGPSGFSGVWGDGSVLLQTGHSPQQGFPLKADSHLKVLDVKRHPNLALTALYALGSVLVFAYFVVQCFKALKYKKTNLGNEARRLAEGEDPTCSVSGLPQKGRQCNTGEASFFSP